MKLVESARGELWARKRQPEVIAHAIAPAQGRFTAEVLEREPAQNLRAYGRDVLPRLCE
jgi:hypothetical protein